ncbi:MAG TPA: hypothetical protein VF571_16830 [Pyrinomonadaceae bacterium]|jgi:hypothetical protein
MLHTRKTLLLILFCIFIVSSCKKAEIPCNLTPEQAPEIRGIRLGMSYNEIANKFRIKCNLDVNSSSLYKKERFSIQIKDVDFYNKYKSAIGATDQYDLKGLDAGCFSDLDKNVIGFNPSKFPELEGIDSLRLSFDESKLIVGIGVNYATKHNEKFTFQKLTDSLDLSKWNNWYIEPKINIDDDSTMSRGTLLCNNLVIQPEITYFIRHGNAYSVNLDFWSTTDDELVFIRNSIVEAQKTEEQKKKEEAEKSNAESKKRAEEEKRIREPFRP